MIVNVDHLAATGDQHPPESLPIDGLLRVVEITDAGLLITFFEEPS